VFRLAAGDVRKGVLRYRGWLGTDADLTALLIQNNDMVWYRSTLRCGKDARLDPGLCTTRGRCLVSGAGRVDSTNSFRFMPILSLQMQTVTR
jgi:hypothetical protein